MLEIPTSNFILETAGVWQTKDVDKYNLLFSQQLSHSNWSKTITDYQFYV